MGAESLVYLGNVSAHRGSNVLNVVGMKLKDQVKTGAVLFVDQLYRCVVTQGIMGEVRSKYMFLFLACFLSPAMPHTLSTAVFG